MKKEIDYFQSMRKFNIFVRMFLSILFIVFIVSCQSDEVKVDKGNDTVNVPVPTAPAEDIWEDPKTYKTDWVGKDQWTGYLLEALGSHGSDLIGQGNPKDALSWCKGFTGFSEAQRVEFYVMLFSAMSKKESNHNPNTTYQETFKDSKGNRVVSRGLLQLSLESANQSAYGCGIKKAEDLHDPKTNLTCGVKIFNHWMKKDKMIGSYVSSGFRGGARYWAVLRGEGSNPQYIKEKLKLVCN